jgi:hypothetical protein
MGGGFFSCLEINEMRSHVILRGDRYSRMTTDPSILSHFVESRSFVALHVMDSNDKRKSEVHNRGFKKEGDFLLMEGNGVESSLRNLYTISNYILLLHYEKSQLVYDDTNRQELPCRRPCQHTFC